jgi:hypothetical protein
MARLVSCLQATLLDVVLQDLVALIQPSFSNLSLADCASDCISVAARADTDSIQLCVGAPLIQLSVILRNHLLMFIHQ